MKRTRQTRQGVTTVRANQPPKWPKTWTITVLHCSMWDNKIMYANELEALAAMKNLWGHTVTIHRQSDKILYWLTWAQRQRMSKLKYQTIWHFCLIWCIARREHCCKRDPSNSLQNKSNAQSHKSTPIRLTWCQLMMHSSKASSPQINPTLALFQNAFVQATATHTTKDGSDCFMEKAQHAWHHDEETTDPIGTIPRVATHCGFGQLFVPICKGSKHLRDQPVCQTWSCAAATAGHPKAEASDHHKFCTASETGPPMDFGI